MQPYFSIVIPTYNRASRISACVDSVINQTFEDWELIIIDDCSTDNTFEVLKPFLDKYPQITYLKNKYNLERSLSRNKGIEHAQGKYVCFLDSDDHYLPNHLSVCYGEIKSKREPIGMFFTGYTWNFLDKKQKVVLPEISKGNEVEWIITNQVATPSVTIHSMILRRLKFNESLIINEDVELYSRIVAEYPLFKISNYTINIFIHDGSTKNVYKDYLTPQIRAHKIIYSHPLLKTKISKEFKRKKLTAFYFNRVHFFNNLGQGFKAFKESFKFILKYPNHPRLKEIFVIFVYNLPVLGFIFKLIKAKTKYFEK